MLIPSLVVCQSYFDSVGPLHLTAIIFSRDTLWDADRDAAWWGRWCLISTDSSTLRTCYIALEIVSLLQLLKFSVHMCKKGNTPSRVSKNVLCVHVCECVHTSVNRYVETRGQHELLLLRCRLPLFWDRLSHCCPLKCRQPASASPATGVARAPTTPKVSSWVLAQAWVLILASQALCWLNHPSNPGCLKFLKWVSFLH